MPGRACVSGGAIGITLLHGAAGLPSVAGLSLPSSSTLVLLASVVWVLIRTSTKPYTLKRERERETKAFTVLSVYAFFPLFVVYPAQS